MRNNVISPRFDEEEYKGQDVVHQGVRIPLQKYSFEELMSKISKKAQQKLQKPKDLKFIKMGTDHLEVLRQMWFDPNDETFPREMGEHMGITAIEGSTIVGGVIWTEQGSNLFMHQLISDERGKKLSAPIRLIMESMEAYKEMGYHALDIGVSYNPKRYGFFKHFAIETYPIILKKPEIVPVIRLSPFNGFKETKIEGDVIDFKAHNATFFPRASYALYGALKHIGIKEGDQVCIVKTFGSSFISGCVTKMVEKTGAHWKLKYFNSFETKAVIIVHEFGIPVYQSEDLEIITNAKKFGIPIIEDNAWRSSSYFEYSDYKVFSTSKMLNLNYGGILIGAHINDDLLWSWGCLDVVKRKMFEKEQEQDEGGGQRKRNWFKYHQLVMDDGMMIDDCYNYEKAVVENIWMPTVYLQKFDSEETCMAVQRRLEEFGIQAGIYWGETLLYLPIHQNMTSADVEYMFAVVRGYFNACRDYGKKV